MRKGIVLIISRKFPQLTSRVLDKVLTVRNCCSISPSPISLRAPFPISPAIASFPAKSRFSRSLVSSSDGIPPNILLSNRSPNQLTSLKRLRYFLGMPLRSTGFQFMARGGSSDYKRGGGVGSTGGSGGTSTFVPMNYIFIGFPSSCTLLYLLMAAMSSSFFAYTTSAVPCISADGVWEYSCDCFDGGKASQPGTICFQSPCRADWQEPHL